MDILKPGCNGVLSDVKKIPNENLKKAYEYIRSKFQLEMDEDTQSDDFDLFEGIEGENADHGWEEPESDHMTEEGEGDSDLFDGFGGEGVDHGWEEPEADHVTEEGGGDFEHGRANRKDEL